MEAAIREQGQAFDADVTANVSSLRGRLAGHISLPNEAGFEGSTHAWNLTTNHRPSLVVEAVNEQDVVESVSFAKENGLAICVQATGHGQPRNCEGGLLLNLRNLTGVDIDPVARLARIAGGTVWKDVIEAAHEHGLVPVSGSSPGVGVVGYTLGGGFGLLSRKYGLAIDTVESFRIVTADGRVREVSASSEPDLFASALGGGGAFGVVTQITMRLMPAGPMFAGSVMFDARLAGEIYPTFHRWCETLPDDVSAAIMLMTFPPVPFVPEFLHGRSMVIVAATVLGHPDEAERWLASIRSIAGAEFDSFRPIMYTESATVFNDPVDPLPAKGRGVLIRDLDDEAISTMLEAIGPAAQSPNLMIQLRQLGGAIAYSDGKKSALGDRRSAKYILYLLGVPMGPVTPQDMEAHAEGVFKALAPYVLCRGPLNWVGEGDVTHSKIKDVFHADDYSSLAATKAHVDPDNVFRFASLGLD